MQTFLIESKAGVFLGEYRGETPEEALAAMAADGGITEETLGTVADYIITLAV
jgi:hypothetical protein